MKYWIKERRNPQLGTSYSYFGQLTLREAKRYESTLYGFNVMHPFPSPEAAAAELARLKEAGERVNALSFTP